MKSSTNQQQYITFRNRKNKSIATSRSCVIVGFNTELSKRSRFKEKSNDALLAKKVTDLNSEIGVLSLHGMLVASSGMKLVKEKNH